MKPAVQRAVLAGLVLVMAAVWGRAILPGRRPADEPQPATEAPAPALRAEPRGDRPQEWSSLLTGPSAQRAAQAARAEELTWSRDPFRSGGGGGPTGGFTLSGILWDANAPIAIINGQMLRSGETIDGYRVTQIGQDRVSLTDGEQSVQLLIAP